MQKEGAFKIHQSKPCKNCDPIIILLTQQINELNQRQINLQRVNQTLTKALNKSKTDSQKQYLLKVDWKNKYEQEIARGYELQKQLKMLQLDNSSTPDYSNEKTPFRTNQQNKQNYKSGMGIGTSIQRKTCQCRYENNIDAYQSTSKKNPTDFQRTKERAFSLRQTNYNQSHANCHSVKNSFLETSLKQSRKKSMKKMQNLMDTIIKKRNYEEQMQQFFDRKGQQNHGTILRKRANSSKNLGLFSHNNEIIVRIVDQRRKGQRSGFRT